MNSLVSPMKPKQTGKFKSGQVSGADDKTQPRTREDGQDKSLNQENDSINDLLQKELLSNNGNGQGNRSAHSTNFPGLKEPQQKTNNIRQKQGKMIDLSNFTNEDDDENATKTGMV